MSRRTGYSTLQISLHWLIALLIFGAFFTHEAMETAYEIRLNTGQTGAQGNTLHVWLGGAAFALILIRVLVRLTSGTPGPVAGTSPLMAQAATWGHRVLYALMILAPLSGAAAWYGHVEPAAEIHEPLGKALFFIALGHAAVAIWHQVVQKDGVMMRMLKPGD